MSEDEEVLSVRLSADTVEQIENLAEERGIRKSDAARNVIDSGVTVERTDRPAVSAGSPDEPRSDSGDVIGRLEQTERQVSRSIGNVAIGFLLGWVWIAMLLLNVPGTITFTWGIVTFVFLLGAAVIAYRRSRGRRADGDGRE